MQTIEPYFLGFFWRDGVIVARQWNTKTVVRDEAGEIIAERENPAEEISVEDLEEVLGDVNAGLLARISEIETLDAAKAATIAELEAMIQERGSRIAELEAALEAATAEIETLETSLAAATAPPAVDLASLDAAFFRDVPAEMQPAFASAWVNVRVLVLGGKIGLAASYVRGLAVPAELEAVRDGIADSLEAAA